MPDDKRFWTLFDYALIVLAMGLMGAFYWAIRGTSGYGGESGGILAGFGWGLLWYGFSNAGPNAERRPYGHLWALVAIMLGIAFGGFTGYGVYISWLNGKFYLNIPEGLRDVGAWTGYAMLFACGLHWGGNAGCFLAWCAPIRPMREKDWAIRILCGLAGAAGALAFVRCFPQLFLPYYGEGLYAVPEYATCQRALGSVRNIAPHVGLVLGFLAYEIGRRDWRAVGVILTLGLGFAIPFAVGGYWQTMYDSPLKLSWWKNWEMSIGLGGGLAIGLAFWLFNRPADRPRGPLGPRANAFFRSGFPFWFPCASMIKSAYHGWCEIHKVAPSGYGYAALLLLSLLPFLLAWLRQRRASIRLTEAFRLPFLAIVGFQTLIVGLGYLVSIPVEWQLANVFLAAIYTICIGVSFLLIGVLRRRQRAKAGQ